MTKEQLQTIADLVAIAHDEYDGCPGYRDDLERYDRVLAEIKAEAQPAPGNAAAMREALERCNEFFRCDDDNKLRLCTLARKADEATQAALSAPARNCDRFATEDEAREAYWAYREPLEFNDKPFVAITEWLFAPAEEGGRS